MVVQAAHPEARLVAYTAEPYKLAVASARSCYSTKIVFKEEVSDEQKERLGRMLFESGHHTPFQHPAFVFAISGVSRHLVWSFLHSHPFYNSEQSSQRYNVMKEPSAFIPPNLDSEAAKVYEEAVSFAWAAYFNLTQALESELRDRVSAVCRIKGDDEAKAGRELTKRAVENARYVLPVAATATLYHTVPLIVLQRYLSMANSCDAPYEANLLVGLMAGEVERVAPGLLSLSRTRFDSRQDAPLPALSMEQMLGNEKLNSEFDAILGNWHSRLVDYSPKKEELVAADIQNVLGPSVKNKSVPELLDLAVSPGRNPYLLVPLNAWHHSPAMRCLQNVNYTFAKRISHCGDSQEQRHRTLPASRPLLSMRQTFSADYKTPFPMLACQSLGVYRAAMQRLWDSKNRLLELGVSPEFAAYLLPNAANVRYFESGSLLNYMHKWRLRTCFNAQAEIWEHSMDELSQAAAAHPNLTKHIGPPCHFRNGLVKDDPVKGPCSEASWCGVKVWLNFPRVKRPF